MDDFKDLKIVMIPTDKVIPYWRNPRRHDRTVDELSEAIPEMGFDQPIVVDKNLVVVKGHARLKAAKKLGMKNVPCIISDADPDRIKADRIADNRIQEMSLWDMAALHVEMERHPGMKFKRLFEKDSIQHVGLDFSQALSYVPTSLDDYGAAIGDEAFSDENYGYGPNENRNGSDSYDDEGCQEAPEASESFDQFQEGNYKGEAGETEMEPSEGWQEGHRDQSGRKGFKTLCPYCGKPAYVYL